MDEGKRIKWEGGSRGRRRQGLLQVSLAAQRFCSEMEETRQPGGRSLLKSAVRLNFNRNGSQAS